MGLQYTFIPHVFPTSCLTISACCVAREDAIVDERRVLEARCAKLTERARAKMGKALLEGHHLEHLRLNPILLKHVVAEPLSLKDLALLDEDLARGLDALLNMDPDDVPSLCLTWSVSDDLDVNDQKWTRDLVPNGSEIPVVGRSCKTCFWAARAHATGLCEASYSDTSLARRRRDPTTAPSTRRGPRRS